MRTLTLAIPAIFLAVAACGGGGDDSSSGDDVAEPDAPAGDVVEVDCGSANIAETVTTTAASFAPETLTISVGEVVEYAPSAGHNVNGSGISVPTGGTECYRFDAAGDYEYSCTIHGFSGTTTVE